MEKVFNFYSSKVVRGTDEFEMFSKFFKEDRNYAEHWLDSYMQNVQTKSDNKADELRRQGNEFYLKKEFPKSLEIYTKALCNAPYGSETYGIILGNRSAVLYMMKDYKADTDTFLYLLNHSACDINWRINFNCSESICLKVYVRKVKCYAKMKLQDELNDAVAEALNFLEKCTQIKNKESIKEDILKSSLEQHSVSELNNEFSEELPKLKDGHNSNFLYASSAIQINYDDCRGRHVVATKRLEAGDVLFVEKPFIFAPVFINEDMELALNKCYHCLKTVSSCLPCKYCVKCIFCDEKCYNESWDDFHKWECVGMQAGLWYHTGIAFPALRAVIKGVPSGFCTLSSDYRADTMVYGNQQDNYAYFNKLVSNISKMKNVLPLIISAAVVTLYLQKQTNFFGWLKDQPACPKKGIDDLVLLVGGLITRHIAQLQCNSSAISHKDTNSSCEHVPIACAIYPSVSMMNHSCKPNITMYYIRDTVIVKAAERIQPNEEIFNCYGIDYRFDSWANRQEQCKSLYYFTCKCRICKFPSLECIN